MLSTLYQSYSRHILIAAALLLPLLAVQSNALPTNNDIETWLPDDSPIAVTYAEFTDQFGAEEIIAIGLRDHKPDDPLVESIAARLDRIQGVRQCWSPARLAAVMRDLGVSEDEIQSRLKGLVVAPNGQLVGLICLLSDHGITHRVETVSRIREQLSYCLPDQDKVLISGGPVVVSELDRLGNPRSNQKFFFTAFLICGILLYQTLHDLRLSIGIVGTTLWAVAATQAAVKVLGGEMNFLLSALPVMVMIFTLAITVHYLHYFRSCRDEKSPVATALRKAIRPCFWASLTTVIGLLSLTVSEFGPVRQFGWAASVGAAMALVAGLGLTPALVTLWPQAAFREPAHQQWLARLAAAIVNHRRKVALTTIVLVTGSCIGLAYLRSHIDPVDFLPTGSRVAADLQAMERELAPTASIEAVVDFGIEDIPFVEKLERVREMEREVARVPGVERTVSLCNFFPTQMPSGPLEAMRILNRASSKSKQSDFLSSGERYWRISARVSGSPKEKFETYTRLCELSDRYPIRFTGLAPMLFQAQQGLFHGLWTSFATAFIIITIVMALSLRSVKLSLIAMIPNLTPIAVVFGFLGWGDVRVDIGMMMTASIALGIAVDGTFHFVMAFHSRNLRHGHRPRAALGALMTTGAPIMQAALIASVGMLALTMSQFVPTVRFGTLMATLLLVALLGDLVLLPALLAVRLRKPAAAEEPVSENTSREAAGPVMAHLPEANAA